MGAPWQVPGLVIWHWLADNITAIARPAYWKTSFVIGSACCRTDVRELLVQLQRRGVWLLVTSRCSLSVGLQNAEQLQLKLLAGSPQNRCSASSAPGFESTDAEHVHELVALCQRNSLYLHIIGGLLRSGAVRPEVRVLIAAVVLCFRLSCQATVRAHGNGTVWYSGSSPESFACTCLFAQVAVADAKSRRQAPLDRGPMAPADASDSAVDQPSRPSSGSPWRG